MNGKKRSPVGLNRGGLSLGDDADELVNGEERRPERKKGKWERGSETMTKDDHLQSWLNHGWMLLPSTAEWVGTCFFRGFGDCWEQTIGSLKGPESWMPRRNSYTRAARICHSFCDFDTLLAALDPIGAIGELTGRDRDSIDHLG